MSLVSFIWDHLWHSRSSKRSRDSPWRQTQPNFDDEPCFNSLQIPSTSQSVHKYHSLRAPQQSLHKFVLQEFVSHGELKRLSTVSHLVPQASKHMSFTNLISGVASTLKLSLQPAVRRTSSANTTDGPSPEVVYWMSPPQYLQSRSHFFVESPAQPFHLAVLAT